MIGSDWIGSDWDGSECEVPFDSGIIEWGERGPRVRLTRAPHHGGSELMRTREQILASYRQKLELRLASENSQTRLSEAFLRERIAFWEALLRPAVPPIEGS